MPELRYSPDAHADLKEIKDYISKKLQNPQAANHTMQKIRKDISHLRRFPEMGRVLHQEICETQYRYLLSGNYLIFYFLDGKTLWIDRVIYSRRDYITILFGGTNDRTIKH